MSDMEDDPNMDDDDFRRSSLNLSNTKTIHQPNREAEKGPRICDKFQRLSTPARRQKHEGRTRKD